MFLRKTRAATTTSAATAEPVATEADVTEIEEVAELEMAEVDDADDSTAEFVNEPGPTTHLRRKDLIERTAARTGLRKGEVKPAIEAALEVLSESLDAGEGLILPPFGRLKVIKRKDLEKGEVLITRIRRSAPEEQTSDEALAEAAE